jgi:hypothetical protein
LRHAKADFCPDKTKIAEEAIWSRKCPWQFSSALLLAPFRFVPESDIARAAAFG